MIQQPVFAICTQSPDKVSRKDSSDYERAKNFPFTHNYIFVKCHHSIHENVHQVGRIKVIIAYSHRRFDNHRRSSSGEDTVPSEDRRWLSKRRCSQRPMNTEVDYCHALS